VAKELLKPGGRLVSYVGQSELPHVLEAVGKHLRYVWTAGVTYRHWASQCRQRGLLIRNLLRLAVIWVNGEYPDEPRTLFFDWTEGTEPEKEFDDRQQSVGDAGRFVETFSRPGDLVVDPMAGTFTTGVVCKKTGRRFVGCDVDETKVMIGKIRVAATAPWTPTPLLTYQPRRPGGDPAPGDGVQPAGEVPGPKS
jgi:site-specific DNA-methyltransferase (adenine-specific)